MKRSRILTIFLLPVLATLGLALFFLISIPLLSRQISETLGPPSPQLSVPNRLRLSLRLFAAREELTSPTDPFGEQRAFQISLGESPTSVSRRLEENGLIADAALFRSYLIYKGMDTQIQAGEYELSPAESPVEIAAQLMDPLPGQATLVILPGWRLEEVAAALPTSGLAIDPETFIRLGREQQAEGYLLPGTYTLPRETRAQALLDILRAKFHQAVSGEIEAGFKQQGLTLHEAVTLASIVERESVIDGEMPLIASVFHNRLDAGMKLDADPTVQYTRGYVEAQDSWWINPITAADLQIDSPYNTYLYTGLPPGPICNPSIDALRAVAFPAQTPYYYFRSACDGSGRHTFAETFEEHLGNECP
jgi:UPF0755 protein